MEKISGLFGRRKIFAEAERITPENVVEEVNRAFLLHGENLREEDYLYWYRRGVQPILGRKKEIRPEICSRIVVNNAEEVVTFKNGYFLTEPVSYVARKDDRESVEKVRLYNEYVFASGKAAADNTTADWFHTVGLGVEYLEPGGAGEDDPPVRVYALDPRAAFVAYSRGPGEEPVMGIHTALKDGALSVDVFTADTVYRLAGPKEGGKGGRTLRAEKILEIAPNPLGLIPLVEYQYNAVRAGAFENAVGLMDAINLAESNRLDGIEQAVQQLCVAYNCQFEEGTTANSIRQAGMLVLRSIGENKADFKILDSVLDQTATQTTLDDLYAQMLEKCGVPSARREGGFLSENAGAVYLRSGWAAADTACRCTEDLYRESNRRFDRIFLRILGLKGLLELSPGEMKLCFLRNHMDNLLAKTEAALNMKELGLAPEIWLERSGLSGDPASDVVRSERFRIRKEEKAAGTGSEA